MADASVEYVTVKELALRYKVAEQTVRGWLHRKQLEKVKIGGRVLITAQAIHAFMQSDEVA